MKTARLIIVGKGSRYCIIYGKKMGDNYCVGYLSELKRFVHKLHSSVNRNLVRRTLEEGI